MRIPLYPLVRCQSLPGRQADRRREAPQECAHQQNEGIARDVFGPLGQEWIQLPIPDPMLRTVVANTIRINVATLRAQRHGRSRRHDVIGRCS
jgi:hypothetical protein